MCNKLIALVLHGVCITVKHKQTTRWVHIKKGLPQGEILSPFLRNLIVDNHSLINCTTKNITGYLQAFAENPVSSSLAEGNEQDVL